MKRLIIASLLSLSACAGGTQEAQLMPTPVLCDTIYNLGPVYARIGEYLAEAKRRGTTCSAELGSVSTIRIR